MHQTATSSSHIDVFPLTGRGGDSGVRTLSPAEAAIQTGNEGRWVFEEIPLFPEYVN